MQVVNSVPNFQFWVVCSDKDPCPDPIEKKIRSFANLQEGWDYGHGTAPRQVVIDKAIEVYQIGKGLGLDAQAFPVVNGDIELSLYMRDHFMDILIRDDGRMEFSYEIGIGEKYRKIEHIDNISMDGVKKRLCDLPKLCGASESSETITIQLKEDLPPAVLRTTREVFRFLIENASRNVILPRSANISRTSIVPAAEAGIP